MGVRKFGSLPHGRIDGAIPAPKLEEFLHEAASSKRSRAGIGNGEVATPVRKRHLRHVLPSSEEKVLERRSRRRRDGWSAADMDHWVACDVCETWHVVSELVHKMYEGEKVAQFRCSFLNKAC